MATGSVGPRQHIAVPYDSLSAMSLNGSNTTSNPGTGHTMATGNLSTPTISGARIPLGSALLSGSGAASGVGSRNTVTQKSFDIKSQSSARYVSIVIPSLYLSVFENVESKAGC